MTNFDPREQLLDRRTVMLSGSLEGETVTEAAAMLMTLDGRSSEPVSLLISGSGGPIRELLTLVDVVGLMRAPVATTCLGAVAGTAAALVACGTGGRIASPRATFTLRTEDRSAFEGHASEVSALADELLAARSRYIDVLVGATGRSNAEIAEAVDRGPMMSAAEAVEFGLVDGLKI